MLLCMTTMRCLSVGYALQPRKPLAVRVISSLRALHEPSEFGPSFQLPLRPESLFLETANAHPLDGKLTFNEDAHKYYFDGAPLAKSVTGVLGNYFEKFDAPKVVEKMIQSSNWPRPQYTHPDGKPFSAAEILTNWDNVGELARNRGDMRYSVLQIELED